MTGAREQHVLAQQRNEIIDQILVQAELGPQDPSEFFEYLG